MSRWTVPFNEYLTLDTKDPNGISITDIYRTIFSSAHDRIPGFRGVVAVAIWGILVGLASSGIKKAPLASAAPPNGASIMDQKYLAEWMASDTGMSYKGDTLVSFGIGVDLTADLSKYNPEVLDSLYYANPANRGASKEMYLHNHGVVFRGVPYDASLDLNSQVKKITNEARFVDMRHMLDSTRLKKAKIGVAYIQDIVKDS